MHCRHNVLLSVSALLITGVHFAASQSAATLTVPTLTESVTSVESVITSTAEAGDRVGTSTVQEDQVILSTTTDDSTVSISTQTVVVTTGNPNTIFITTGQERETAPAESSVAASSAASTGDVPVLTSTANAQSEGEGLTSGRGGLSAGAKAGTAVGSILGAVLVASIAYFCLKARSEARPRSSTLGLDSGSHTRDSHSVRTTSEKRPDDTQPEPSPEQMTHPAYAANHRLSDHMNLTGIVFEEKDDSPMYIGVPTHLSGGKRWSKGDQSKIGVPVDEP